MGERHVSGVLCGRDWWLGSAPTHQMVNAFSDGASMEFSMKSVGKWTKDASLAYAAMEDGGN